MIRVSVSTSTEGNAMSMRTAGVVFMLMLGLAVAMPGADDAARANGYDAAWSTQWANHARTLLATAGKTAGFVLQVGDSITHSNPYCQWPRYGAGKNNQ